MYQFKILKKDGNARLGRLKTPHGIIDTPNFIPVGTKATVKALSPQDLKEIGIQIILANTYHLMLRPGEDLIQKMGGLHKFMSWDRPTMTDSGGYQVFSLGIALEHGGAKVLRRVQSSEFRVQNEKTRPRLNNVTEEGVTFKSHLDGTKYILTPEKAMDIQVKLGADLIVAFDDHESSKDTHEQMQKSLELTQRWGIRSIKALKALKSKQLMYGVIHGGVNKDLRVASAKFTDKYFDAIAIGGIYGNRKKLVQIIKWVSPFISDEKPRHLLGIGEVDNLLDGVEEGMDLFDCIAPTRRARHGSLYVYPNNTINIRQKKFAQDSGPIDPKCVCLTCKNFSRSYLRHLFLVGELLYHHLATYHNVYFINNLMGQIRKAIQNGQFKKLKAKFS